MPGEPASTREWQERVEPRRVLVADITYWHPIRDDYVQAKHRAWWRSFSGDVYPHAVRDPRTNRIQLRDGHHRVARLKRLGHKYAWVRLYEPPANE